METSATDLGAFGLAGPVLATLIEPFINKIPGDFKRLVPVALGLLAGILKAVSSGQPWQSGILNGLTMAGTAVYHHDANMSGPVTTKG